MTLTRRLAAEALGTAFLTSFANPAVSLARAATNTFTGIRASDVGGFVAVEIVAALAATFLARWFYQTPKRPDPT
jgi:glycerol uptake facilitator-like aquaporin